jgi:Holliday junction resolvase
MFLKKNCLDHSDKQNDINMSKKGASSNYAKGISAEGKVASVYRSKGWSVTQSAGSRGAADLKCSKGSTTHYVQVKSTQNASRTPYISNAEQGRLKSTATRNGATSVVAKVTPNNTDVYYAKNGNSIKF